MLQVMRSEFVSTESATSFAALKAAFERCHVVRLREFLHPELLAAITAGVRTAAFYHRDHDGIAREDCMSENTTLALLWLLMNDPYLFRFIEQISGCDTIRFFSGRVYMLRPGAGHFDRWHSDATDGRLVGISINLSEGAFSGGCFQLTHAGREEPEQEIANTGAGDAVLFRIRADLRHRVTAIEGDVARIAYAGWFQSTPDFLSELKGITDVAESTARG